MRNTPKLQDTLEVFLDKLDSVQEALKGLDRFELTADSKIKELKNSKMDVRIEPIQKWGKELINELSNQKFEFSSTMNRGASLLKEINEKRKEKLTHFYMYTGIAFLIAVGGMFFGIKAQMNQRQIKSEKDQLEQQNFSMFEFIKKQGQVNEFREWLGKK